MPDSLPIAQTEATPAQTLALLPAMSNRHGLVAGATGTGKTVTLQVMAEALSRIGVPVFAADVKGDLSGISQAAAPSDKLNSRLQRLALSAFPLEPTPVVFWDVFGQAGHPIRATVSEMGPLLLARILSLNDVQSGVLALVFKIADDHGLLLLDLKDLQATLQYVSANAAQFQTQYGNVSASSVGAIQRALTQLGSQGGDLFFGEPALDVADILRTDPATGRGVVNLLAADRLIQAPQLYSTFLLWLLSELFEHLPEAGDLPQPKLVFFFDEAHLLFGKDNTVLRSRIEQVVRLIRSKGVGVFFVTQNPGDLPDTVLSQLGNRVQHALRAFTPRDQKAVRTAAETFPPQPKARHGPGHHRARRRRSPGQPARPAGHPDGRRARPGLPAPFADRPRHPRAAKAADADLDRRGQVRHPGRQRQRLRTPHPTRVLAARRRRLGQPHLATARRLAAAPHPTTGRHGHPRVEHPHPGCSIRDEVMGGIH